MSWLVRSSRRPFNTNSLLVFTQLTLILLIRSGRVSGDHGQWDCQANELYIECGSCEGSCKMPIVKDCSSDCRPPRCECIAHNGFVRSHDGACILASECETYALMSHHLHPGQQVTMINPSNSVQAADHQPSAARDETHTTQATETTPQEANEHNEHTQEHGSPPSISPQSDAGRKAIAFTVQNKNAKVLDRDSATAKGTNRHALTTDSTATSNQVPPTQRPSTLVGNEERSSEESGYWPQPPPQSTSQTYGARPLLRGEVSDRYVPKMPSGIEAPSGQPTAPGLPPPTYKYAYAPAIPVLMQDDRSYALYPPQKFRIYRRRRDLEMPMGPVATK